MGSPVATVEWEKFNTFSTLQNIFKNLVASLAGKNPFDTHGVSATVYLLCLLHFYQAYCSSIVRYCHITGGIRITFQI